MAPKIRYGRMEHDEITNQDRQKAFFLYKGPSLYYVSKRTGVGGWVQKMASFANVQYYIYAD